MFPPDWDDKKYGNPEYNYTFQTSASASVTRLLQAAAHRRRAGAPRAARCGGGEMERAGRRAYDRAERGGAQGVGPAHQLRRDRGLRAGARPSCRRSRTRTSSRPASFRLIGKDVPRVDVPLKVTGAAKYGMDVQVPGMVYAAVLQSPYPGGAPLTVDDARGAKGAGHHRRGEAARRRRRHRRRRSRATQAAKNLLKVTWGDAPGAHLDSERALEDFAAIGRDKSRDGVPYEKVGDAKAAMAGAAKGLPRRIPHALRLSRPDGADERDRLGQPRRQIGRDLGRHPGGEQPAQQRRAGCCRPSAPTSRSTSISSAAASAAAAATRRVLDAVRLAKAVGKPVKLIWSREDDIAFGKFRPMTAHHIEAGFDASGKLDRLAPPRGRRIGGGLYRPAMPTPRQDRIVMKGSPIPQYPIANKLAEHVIENPRRAAVALARRRQRPQRLRGRELHRRDRQGPGQGPARVPAGITEGRAAHADAPARRRRDVGLEAQARGHRARRRAPW